MSPEAPAPLSCVKALTFDVFGTVVDWRTSVTEELALRAHRKHAATDLSPTLRSRLEGLTPDDWARFAQAWRDSYGAFTRSFDPARDVWKTIDAHHRDSLADLLRGWGLDGLYTDAEVESLSLVWHRLRPWPDAADGLSALGTKGGLTTTTLSNGNIALLRDLDDFGSLGFHRLLSAETFRAYKPNPATYLGAARELGLEPSEVAMVAAHLGDLQAARSCGLRTIYVERPQEEAWGKDDEKYQQAREWVDLWISEQEDGLVSLARRLQDL
ncbi:hypothetical protein TOPH_03617 [Tolypocladium ophioglossoides CBS 100239]|uniref:(S)-2-haloacid dehalogenase 4A n=1 Tax=Tolypocladium ophioglossoides (strain CBS 100239) TaxID=1163406 RepID=A0A0L0NC19_TOLOC|nr:hypothetical protein TOPH_03617 [Tolypocladium ophioglossoides CBS 100239]